MDKRSIIDGPEGRQKPHAPEKKVSPQPAKNILVAKGFLDRFLGTVQECSHNCGTTA